MLTGSEQAEAAQTSRRKTLLKVLALLVVTVLTIGTILSAYLVQPLVFPIARRDPGFTVQPHRLEDHVRRLSQEFGTRDVEHPENLDRCADYISEQFKQAGGLVYDQPFERNGITYRNVIATFGPNYGGVLVVGAHYDSAGPRPGADDNASGVAGLIELAYLLGQSGVLTHVELVAYTLEEPPVFRTDRMGSAVHAKSLGTGNVRAMIGLEMIGCFTDAPNSQRFPIGALAAFYPTTGNFISVVGRAGGGGLVRTVKRAMSETTPLPVYSINAPSFVPGIDFSDHLNYWNAGFPAVMVTDTSFYRNSRYHTMEDTADTLDYVRMSRVVVGVHAAVLALTGP